MTYSPSKLIAVRTSDRHIRDQIGDITHLVLLATSIDNRCTIRILLGLRTIRNTVNLRIESFQSFKCRPMLNLTPIIRDNYYMIPIKIRTRQTFCHLGMNDNRVSTCTTFTQTKNLPSFSRTIVDREFRNFECSRMRITHQNNALTVIECRCKDLIWLHTIRRKNNLCCLTWHISSLKMHSCRIGFIPKRLKKFPLN